VRKLIILCFETLLTKCFQSSEFTVAVGAARHDSGKVLSEPIVFGVSTKSGVTEVTNLVMENGKGPRCFRNVAFI